MELTEIKPNLRIIVATVLLVHLLFGWWMLREPTSLPIRPVSPQRVMVKTIALTAKSEISPQQPSPSEVQPVKKKPASVPSPKVVTAEKPLPKPQQKKPVEKKVAPLEKKPPTPTPSTDKQEVAAKVRASLAQLRHDPATPSTAAPLVIALPVTAVATADVPQATVEPSYLDELAIRLKAVLRLPEYGEVKADITLDRTGKVLALRILAAESSANRRYVEATVPKSKFPDFGKHFEGETQHVFTLILSNDF